MLNGFRLNILEFLMSHYFSVYVVQAQNSERWHLFSLHLENRLMFDLLDHGNSKKEVRAHNHEGIFFIWKECSGDRLLSKGGVFYLG